MPRGLNKRTIGKIREAYSESEAIAKLATEVARLERAVREAEDIGNAACREAEARAEAAERRVGEAEEDWRESYVGWHRLYDETLDELWVAERQAAEYRDSLDKARVEVGRLLDAVESAQHDCNLAEGDLGDVRGALKRLTAVAERYETDNGVSVGTEDHDDLIAALDEARAALAALHPDQRKEGEDG